ncbi:TonB-dependent receptor [Pedobacter sp. N23S346]|uniref:TonB-dependent receptor n=1 Tax=Pedobacter sp. N23S346 TaxID=3402750 RepID=UPI003ABEC96A
MKILFTSISLFLSITTFAQISKTDSTKKLNEVVVRGYYNNQPLLRSVSAVSLIDSNMIRNQQNSSLVSTFNTVPGLRMEERSPGSYRLSLRGSLLRSPFGIRNIKIYIDDFPLTDAGGNTYLNALDPLSIANIEIYKGPEASVFGANTGGAILISPQPINENSIAATITAGSYDLFHQTASIQRKYKNYSFSFMQGYQRSDGFREHSAMERKYFQTNHQWDYSNKGNLKLYAFYSDLNYETPGGLTLAQFELDAKAARPATATLPGAVTQQAAIYNKTLFGGLSNNYQISKNFKHVIALFGSYTDFKNPFITNYEKRYEGTLGLRTFVDYQKTSNLIKFNAQLGVESGATKTQIKNFDNNAGSPAAIQAFDHLKANQNFAFLRFNLDISNKLLIELASSLNFYKYNYESFLPVTVAKRERKFDAELMPKLAASYLINNELSIRASVSKGYSPPTIAEVRASDNNINNNIQAELGWNYEAGFRYHLKNNRLRIAANVFQFNLNDAIVRRLNANDAEFFINAGGTTQKGLELETAFWLIRNSVSFLKAIELKSNYTYSHFRFREFTIGNVSFDRNKLTGVPANVVVSSLDFQFSKGLYFFAQHNYTASIPLNDGNTVFAKNYHLVELKTGMRNIRIKKIKLEVFGGVNNLLNQKYSLGNDLNAMGGRYYNAAASINYYLGTSIKL